MNRSLQLAFALAMIGVVAGAAIGGLAGELVRRGAVRFGRGVMRRWENA